MGYLKLEIVAVAVVVETRGGRYRAPEMVAANACGVLISMFPTPFKGVVIKREREMLSPNTDGAEAASPSITTEEADQLDHSTKRAKKVVDRGGTRSNARAGEPSQGRSGVADDPKVGYVAALQGSQIGAGSGIFLGGPESEQKAKSMVLGRNVGYTTLKRRLNQLWSPIGHFDLVDLPNNFYAARFSSVDAKEWVMLGGPWIIQGNYLTVREWTHDFNPRLSRITKVAVWVRISDLPMDYHTDLSLRRIGYALGRTMKIDKHTQGLIQGNYARLCAEVIREGNDQEVEMTIVLKEDRRKARLPLGQRRMAKGWSLRPMIRNLGHGCKSGERIANHGNKREDRDLLGEKKGKGEGVRAAAGRPKVLTRKSVDQGLTRASPVQKPDASGFTRLTILRRNGYGRTNPLAAAQHQDSPRVQGAGPADAAHLQVDGAAANSTCGESFCLIRDPDSNRDDSTLACEGLNDMEDDLPKVNFQLLDGVILDGRVGEEDERPRISGARADAVCQKFTSFTCERIEAQGFAGVVYARLVERAQLDLWRFLLEVSKQVIGPWLVLGDFNELASAEEKRGGAPFDPNRAARFHEVLEQSGLLDLGSTGPRFTWRGVARGGYDRVFERLDRAVCNAE
ncbi:hypothetical protein CRG98_034905 [Punica granatum]|uniref:DUF4283 domain-containing protein n=1 Tax=Punica granatum TaxID=22663 RepID=A0A2I0IL44_PUNGR|nr:hypothetical protein CRG98_034905 [Punica granatum]